MEIKLYTDTSGIRNKFKEKFLLPYDEYIKVHPNVGDTYAKHDITFDEERYSQMFMWDRLTSDFINIAFEKALEMLKSTEGHVRFISEGEEFEGSCNLKLDGQSFKGFLAKGNAKELAELIEYEWHESWRLAMEDHYFDGTLPEDLYVFDESMEWVLVFTHEGNGRTMQEQAKSRWCYMYVKI